VGLKFGTIFGAQVGFEIFTKQDFEGAGLPALWGFMVNLLFFRVTVTKYE
jgi:hypothetical protein